jgi:hypothetical protein
VQFQRRADVAFRHGAMVAVFVIANLVFVPFMLSAAVSAHKQPGVMVGIAVVSALLWGIWVASCQSKVVIGPGGITVDSLFLRRFIPWDQFTGINADGGLSFELKDGTEISTISHGGSLLGAVTGYRGLQRVRNQMLAACAKYRSTQPDGGQVARHGHEPVRQVRVAWWPLLAYLGPLEAVAIIADLATHAS